MRAYYGSKMSTACVVKDARSAHEALIAEGGKVRCGAVDGRYTADAIRHAIEHRWFYRMIQDGIAYYVTNYNMKVSA